MEALKKSKSFKYCCDDLSVMVDLDRSLPSQVSVVEVTAKPPPKPNTIVTFTGVRRETMNEVRGAVWVVLCLPSHSNWSQLESRSLGGASLN